MLTIMCEQDKESREKEHTNAARHGVTPMFCTVTNLAVQLHSQRS